MGELTDERRRGPRILYAPMPRNTARVPIIAVATVAVIGAAALLYLALPHTFPETYGGAALFVVTVASVMFGVLYIHFRRRRDPLADVDSATLSPIVRGLHARDRATPYFIRRPTDLWGWNALQEHIRGDDRRKRDTGEPGVALEQPLPTVVDRDLEARLAALDLPDYLLEPEPILPSGNVSKQHAILLGGMYIVVALIYTMTGQYLFTVLWLGLGLMFIGAIPSVRDRLRNIRLNEGRVTAAPGTIRDNHDRRWTIDDSVMIVQTSNGKPPLFVFVTGPAGVMPLHFTDETDPDFIKLWQRWNHPHPRPELAGQSP